MEESRVKEIYAALEDMKVVLPQNPQLGFEFYRDLLAQVRGHQDAVSDFIIEANKDFARVKIQIRGIKKSIQLAGPAQAGPYHEKYLSLEDEGENLKYLLDSVRMKKSNLAGASSDIRLTVSVMESQIKIGEIGKPKPGERPTAEHGKTKFQPPAGAGTVTSVEDLAAGLEEPAAEKQAAPPVDVKKAEAPAAPAEAEKLPEAAVPASDPATPPAEKAKKAKAEKPKAAKKTETAAAPVVEEKKAAPGGAVEDIEDIESFLG